jgi:dimeric dUTPase (all-alpha-NTP-PPase superfamily)
MEINFKDIIEAQAILDQTIQTRHQTNYSQIIEELKLALLVELGELANEVRSFKFWSIKPSSKREVVLEEYVDGIHFICSLCIAHNVKVEFILPNDIKLLNKKDLTIAFNKLFGLMPSLDNPDGIHK